MTPLPIAAYRSQILASVRAAAVTILVAETGAGKSTQVPQYLLDAGLRCVVTQPRRLAVMTVAERVAEERDRALGGEVGYRLGGGVHVGSAQTRCLFVTEGLALVRELFARDGDLGYDVLVLDEVHEWHEDMEVLVAWSKRRLAEGARFRLVLMSATMEAEKLSAYFDGAPVIQVPGRVFPVETRKGEELLSTDRTVWGPVVRDVARLVGERRNVLVFCPGKPEIAQVCEALARLDAEVLPLHGELEQREQKRCFRRYARPKVVVATNVAQTSITIEDIDAVVDSGLERRIEVMAGVEGLRLRLISRADSAQRKGRAGRCRPGIYVDHADTSAQCTTGVGVREDWPKPEIQRVLLDRAVLRLAMADLDLEQLDLVHPVDQREAHGAKETLRALGCLGDGIAVTETGRRVARLPTGVRTGRMLVEAEKRGVVTDVTTLAAIVETGGIVDGKAVDPQTERPLWRAHVTDTKSDHVSFVRIYDRAVAAKGAWRQMGLHGKAMSQAIETRRAIAEAAKRVLAEPKHHGTRDDVVKCVVAGLVDQLRSRRTNRWGEYVYGDDYRKLGSASALAAAEVEWAVGVPFDVSTKKGGTLGLLEFVSAVELDWLTEIAPQSIEVALEGEPSYDPERDEVRQKTVVKFRGQMVRTVHSVRTDDAASAAMAAWLGDAVLGAYSDRVARIASETHRLAVMVLRSERELAKDLNDRLGALYYDVGDGDRIRAFLRRAVGSAVRLADVPLDSFRASLVPARDVAEVRALHPDEIEVNGQRVRVTYGGEHPVARVEDWRALPDQLCTPGGRLVRVVVGYGWESKDGTDLRALKAELAALERGRSFESWRDRPEITADGVVEHPYGEDADGAPRLAYGTQRDGYSASSCWFADRAEAEKVWAETARARAWSTLWEAANALPTGHDLRDKGMGTDRAHVATEDMVRLTEACRAALAAIEAKAAAEEQELAEGAAKVLAAMETSGQAWHAVDPRTARSVYQFVRDCAAMTNIHAVAMILRQEEQEAYGRARRSDAIAEHFPGVETRGLDWKQGTDIVPCAVWAEHLARQAPPCPWKKGKLQAPRASGGGGFGTFADLMMKKRGG